MADDYSMSDFVTPGQVLAQRAMAEALLKQSMTTPVGKEHEAVSPFAIGTQMTQALMGRMGLDQAAAGEKASMLKARATGLESGYPGGPSSGGGGLVPVSDATDPEGKALSSLESGGKYTALGPIIKKGSMAGDRAYGKYQVMGSNIPVWTQEFLGHRMTPGEFLNSPEAQEIVRKGKFAQYEQKYGPEGAARAWLGGPGGVNHPERKDQLGTSVGQYGQNFMKLASNAPGLPATGPGGGSASAYAEEPAAAAPGPADAPAAMSTALAGGGGGLHPAAPASPSLGAPATVPGPATAESVRMDPGLFTQRQHVTPHQFMGGANPYMDPSLRQYLDQSFYSQGQPVQFKTPFGTITQTANGHQVFQGDVFQMEYAGPEGIKIPVKAMYNADGTYRILGPVEPTDKRGEGEPVPSTVGGTPGTPGSATASTSPTPPTPAIPSATPPVAAPAPGKSSEAAPTAGGVKTAALETGTAADAPSPGMLGTPPPEGTAGTPEGTKLAGPPPTGGGSSLIPRQADEAIHHMGELGAQVKGRIEGASKAAEAAAKYGDEVQGNAKSAAEQLQPLDELERIFNAPDIISGFAAGPRTALAKGYAWLTGNKDANAAASKADTADKLISDINLSALKTKLGGLGQIRVAEIQMINAASANRNNTVAANKALITMAKAVNNRLIEAGEEIDRNRDPITGAVDPNIRAKIVKLYKEKPLMDEATAKKFEKDIELEKEAAAKPKGTAGKPAVALPPPEELMRRKTESEKKMPALTPTP
jgi:hypothetical protein